MTSDQAPSPRAAQSRVIVFGASGRTGRLIVGNLLDAGFDVTAALRNPGNFATAAVRSSSGQTPRVVHADLRDTASVHAAVAGHDVVVSSIASGRCPDGLYQASADALVSAMRNTGIDRLIVVSSSGAPLDDRGLSFLWKSVIRPLFFRELYSDVRAMEAIIRASDLNWTLIRPARLTDHAPTGTYRIAKGTNPPGGAKITRSDLASFVATVIEEDSWAHGTPTLAQ
ncbi:NAD(P)-dependent oxidoreductase [Mangrovihabitans endophyticus]|uniref:NADH-flavin reductase n=1 Tax=Mangrovihabitans endophyticus TaxID=1751298 RepID=A0A8J3FQM2_9ACTN|nr:NAD(P)H-binding protein [Mangrovihabitans endophyticus]GGL10616.1 NADH-flavin reductase [Mangrovihabitans endophyticus]